MIQINVITDMYTKEEEQSLKEFLLQQITGFTEQLNLSSLKSIFIAKDYVEELKSFQMEHSLEAIGATKSDTAIGVAKVVKYNEADGSLSQTIFFKDQLLMGLFQEKLAASTFHTIHHEFCHVHDNFVMQHIYSQVEDVQYRDLISLLRTHSDIIWREYVVERLSIKSYRIDNVRSDVKYLFEMIEETNQGVMLSISEYKNSHNTGLLFKELQEKANLLLKYSSAFCGAMQGLQEISSECDYIGIISEQLGESYYHDTWQRLNTELNELYAKYPKWESINVLDAVGKVVLKLWNDLGVEVHSQGNRIIIGVVD
ncbi:hypothetical protein EEL30_19975 [Brevibacillus laterosporus]|uniref:Uncharacterized protein n=1 Tax=Brevibacillus laterosporus TaxID=1465 RepID=A0A518VBJ9_BRELA|nr:hypothetical protein EEL30_19975 [Brevibacillus laterosporus]